MTPTAFAASLRATIRANRRANRLTQAAMARALSVSLWTYCDWERGRYNLRIDDLAAIAAALEIPVAALVIEAEKRGREEGER